MQRHRRSFNLRDSPARHGKRFTWGRVALYCQDLEVAESAAVPDERSTAREPRSVRHARRDRAARCGGLVAAVLVHALVAVWLPGSWLTPQNAPGGDASAPVATRPLQVVELSTPRPPPARPEVSVLARPVLRLPEVRVAPRHMAAAVRAAPDPVPAADVGTGRSLLERIGVFGHGSGAPFDGEGPAVDEARTLPAVPIARTILPAWRTPRSLLGLEVLARVHVDADGRPMGPVELHPSDLSPEASRHIAEHVRSLAYRPAREDDAPVRAWAEIGFRFCWDGVTASSPPSPTFGRPDPCSRETVEGRAVSRVPASPVRTSGGEGAR